MKGPVLIISFLFLFLGSNSQEKYWQQEVAYDIHVRLNPKERSLKAELNLDYINHSPDTLDFIWFHLWPNAYKNEKTAFAKQILRDKEGKKRWKDIRDKGYIDGLKFTVDGVSASTESHPEHIDIIKLILPGKLLPGKSARISTPFNVKLSTYNSRSGYEDDQFMICQWYPKPAVYDHKGWHPMPYLDQGEFYSEFGTFRVNITLPSEYIVSATGQLQTSPELEQYRKIGRTNVSGRSQSNLIQYKEPTSPEKTLEYKGERIHDFAWFASPTFVIRYDTLVIGNNVVDVFAFHHPDGNKNWVNSTAFIKDGARKYSDWLGPYAYPVVQAVEGPKNDMSGGMEYPMVTLITSPKATAEYLDAVITHEVGHNWLYGMIGSNERRHAWMDEGINTYLQLRYEAEKYRYNSLFGDMLPAELRKKNVDEFLAVVYDALNEIPMEEPIATHSEAFGNKETYGLVTYIKTAIWMYILELNFGREKMDKALSSYFRQWQFRHPYPEDFRKVLEKELGQDLTAYFDLLEKKGKL